MLTRMMLLGLGSTLMFLLGGCSHEVGMGELPKTATFESVITDRLQVSRPIVCIGCVTSMNIANGVITLADLASQGCVAGNAIRGWSGGSLQCVPVAGKESGAAWSLTGNAGTRPGSEFLGTTDNQPFEIRVGNQHAWHVEPSDTSPNLIGGFAGNNVSTKVAGAAISGGGELAHHHQVTGNFGAIGGGSNNTASRYATVSGEASNTASGTSSVVGGGAANTASSRYATVSGNVRASEGTHILSNSQATVGVMIAPGGNSWSGLSNRNLKEHFSALDGLEILKRLRLIPITRTSGSISSPQKRKSYDSD